MQNNANDFQVSKCLDNVRVMENLTAFTTTGFETCYDLQECHAELDILMFQDCLWGLLEYMLSYNKVYQYV